ncbi:hypothetical protein E8E14_014057 [Neopestalotiopsis sp. 37M]|nr:hypothetical protein E8E14_014057 [Neopestalotiopsis sp. 37M]
MDPSHQHLAGFPLAPSPMPKDSPQGHYTDSFGPGPDGTTQYTYHLQQSPFNEQGYPSPERQAPVTPYSTSHYSITLADHENLICNNVYLRQSYVNLSADHQPSLCHALETQQRQQHSQQPGYEQNMSTHSSYMIPHAFTDDYSEFLTHKPVTTGHSYGAGHAQASLQSPLSQPSQSPKSFNTLGPLTPQCPPSPRLSPLPSPQLSTPSEVNIFTDNETLSTPPAHVIARLSCRECGMVKKDIKSLQPYRGAFIGDHYRLQQLRLQTEFLEIFSVVCLCGRVFEAQAFSLSCPASRGKLLESRRRRMKRIYRSDNFVDVFEEAGRRFLVTKVDRTEKEWSDVCRQAMRGGDDFALERPARLLGWGGARCAVEGRPSVDHHVSFGIPAIIMEEK